ncbi:hypothetical protein [Streptomyces syringium]|uniref:hypothetical protein n=1 Tax=Streptomyces syringium TaxID=76729 RepID=UPI0037D4FDFF
MLEVLPRVPCRTLLDKWVRCQRIEDVLEGLTCKFAEKNGRLPGERARHGLAWQAAQDTRPEKKTRAH